MDRDSVIEKLRQRIEELEHSTALGLLVPALIHEVNNPLAVILIGADTLRHAGEQSPTVLNHLDVLNQQADRIVHTSRRMQELTRRNLSADRVSDLRDPIRLFADLEVILGGDAAHVDLSLPDEPLDVRGDPGHLALILRLLARHVRERSGGEPLELTASTERVKLIQSGPAAERSPVRDYVVVRICAGAPEGEAIPFLKRMPEFFQGTREPAEVELMACWEVIRKSSGRLQLVDGGAGIEIQLLLPRHGTPGMRG